MPDGDMTLRQKSLTGTVKALGARQVRVIVSTPSEDREGDIIEVNGIDLKNYLKNPIILFNHKMDCPIARCTDIKNVGGRLEATAEFPAEGVNPESDKIYNLIKAGIINAASIGFIPVEWNFIDDHSWSRKFSKCEMIEFSFVSVPANAEALIIERGVKDLMDGEMSINQLRSLCKGSTSPMAMSVALQAAAFGASLAEGLKGEPEQKTDKQVEQTDITSEEAKSAEEEKSPKPASCEKPGEKTTAEDITSTGKSDDGDEDDKPGATEKPDGDDEDDKKSLDETVTKDASTESPNPGVVEKSADTDASNEGEQAPTVAESAQTTTLSRQKALRDLELMRLQSVV